jgi:phosphoribosylamine--glycine ligase
MNVLLLGSGGREHAIAWKISQSSKLTHLFIAPGNAGTTLHGTNVELKLNDFNAIKQFVVDMNIEMIIVGPEQPLVDGLYDFINNDADTKDVFVVGMSKQAAQLEGSKDFAKAFMSKYNIPTAAYKTFTKSNIDKGHEFLETLKAPYVLKADGLAGGKGVLIIDNLQEAKDSLSDMLVGNKFGSASKQVVIEEFLSGIELSVFILTDGKDYIILPEAKDYKRIGEGETGLNTGGMGSISPVPFADKAFLYKVEERIIKPTVEGIGKEGFDYTGFVFIGLMNVGGDPYVIEYNVRMGDPETESVIPRIKSDLLDVFIQMKNSNLANMELEIDSNFIASVMMVSGGYPEKYAVGKTIKGLDAVSNSIIFHAGTILDDEGIVLTNGGRVLTVTSSADSLKGALDKSYQQLQKIDFENSYFRSDLGQDLL